MHAVSFAAEPSEGSSAPWPTTRVRRAVVDPMPPGDPEAPADDSEHAARMETRSVIAMRPRAIRSEIIGYDRGPHALAFLNLRAFRSAAVGAGWAVLVGRGGGLCSVPLLR